MESVWRSLNALGVPRERDAIVVYGPRSFISFRILRMVGTGGKAGAGIRDGKGEGKRTYRSIDRHAIPPHSLHHHIGLHHILMLPNHQPIRKDIFSYSGWRSLLPVRSVLLLPSGVLGKAMVSSVFITFPTPHIVRDT